ncbi:MAG: glucose-1-phosphate adenylyltransferase subunit GlgD [Eubacteriales bacterium]|nr:glucose-1-phosphate adenylyltransferase subunit GlgD [Eubacteriales bacterium]
MNAFCILFANAYENNSISEITKMRTPASIPYGGRYRLIDFILSSLVKANVRDVGIITNNKFASLVDHVGMGKDWDLARKNGGLKVLPPYRDGVVSSHDDVFHSLYDVHGYIKDMLQEYCILGNTNGVFNIDFLDVLDFHRTKGADITVVYRTAPVLKGDMEIQCDDEGRVNDAMLMTSDSDQPRSVTMKLYLMKKEVILSLIEKGATYGWGDFDLDVIAKHNDSIKIYGYEHKGYSAIINSLESFYQSNMDLLNPAIQKELFRSEYSIHTRIKDSVPTIYGENNSVKNSFVADGCYIGGSVENSVIFRDVKIDEGAVVKNSIIMQGAHIHAGAQLSSVIADKNVSISEDIVLTGNPKVPFVINKGKVV